MDRKDGLVMKRLISFVVVLVLVLAVFCPFAAAKSNNGKGWGCDEALKQCETIIKDANKEIKNLVKAAQKSAKNDVAECVDAVNAVAAQAKLDCAALGFEIGCEEKEYVIDGQNRL